MRTTVAAVTVVALLVGLGLAWSRPGTEPSVPEPGPAAGAAGTTVTPAAGGVSVGRSPARLGSGDAEAVTRPLRVTMRSTGITAPVRVVGVARDGQMQLPPNPRVLGWYRFGAAPGSDAGGSVVLAGHLDSKRFGLGPLARLRLMQPGDPVEVTLSDGGKRTYRVTTLERFDRQALPDALFARGGPERLRVITCGGAFDAEAGGYEQNLVVTAAPERREPPVRD